MRRNIFLIWVLLAGACLWASACYGGGDDFEIIVHPSETVAPGKTMLELHSIMAMSGEAHKTHGVLPNQHALHETFEIAHGFTPWFELSLYTFTSIQPGMDAQWAGNRLFPHVRIPESWGWPVGLGLAGFISYQKRSFSTDTWTMEILPIIDKRWGPWYFSANPAFGRSLKGKNQSQGFDSSPSFKVSYDIAEKVAVGFEYYASLGPVTGMDPSKNQQHQLFPALDLNLGPDWELNFGAGFGLTPATDGLTLKMILGKRF